MESGERLMHRGASGPEEQLESSATDQREDYDAFNEFFKTLKGGNSALGDMADLITDRKKIAQEYGKRMKGLGEKARALTRDVPGPLRSVWEDYASAWEAEGDRFIEFSNVFDREALKPMLTLKKEQKELHKEIQERVEKAYKEARGMREAVSKARRQTHEKARELEGLYETKVIYDEGRKAGGKGPEPSKKANKLAKEIEQMEESTAAADAEYESSVRKYSLARQKFFEQMVLGAIKLQNHEDNELKSVRESLYACYGKLPSAVDVEGAAKRAEAQARPEGRSDVSRLVDKRRLWAKHTEANLYQFYAADKDFHMLANRRKEKLQRKISELEASLRRECQSLEGVRNLDEIYQGTPDFNDKTIRSNVTRQIANSCRIINSMRMCLYDIEKAYARAIGGRDKDVEPPRLEEVPDFTEYLGAEEVTKGIAKGEDESVDAADVESSTSARPVTSSNGDIRETHALYRFEGSCAEELTVNAGDRLVVLEVVDNNWALVKNDYGDQGVVPNSYLQL
eukprot:comp77380_c0_seq1/m.48269 comp77380_c0_seq1/g.48269  ORF comp77380_c0_seq1/g.48269 comp77380_c0_seq1/m.48269 type:complete len:512 (-) comp77380_c0_seq1:19-1554(-)